MCFSHWERKGVKRRWMFFGLCLHACRLVLVFCQSLGTRKILSVIVIYWISAYHLSVYQPYIFRMRGMLCNISVKANVRSCIQPSVWFKTTSSPCSSVMCMCVCCGDTAKGALTNVIKINLPVGARVYIHQPIWVSLLGWFSLGNSICHLLNAANVHGVPAACVP